jgi:hypothetical protein
MVPGRRKAGRRECRDDPHNGRGVTDDVKISQGCNVSIQNREEVLIRYLADD